MNRGGSQGQPTGQPVQQSAAPAPAVHAAKSKNKVNLLSGMRMAQVALLFCVAILVIAVASFLALGSTKSEASYVDKSKLQAVFLNGGQVYFGDINDLNTKYLSMSNIYYLRVNQQVQPNQANTNTANDISLVKLGCELHGPQDKMVINREQIIFWENLKDDGQVAEAVKKYKEANPGEQKCDTAGQTTNTETTPAADAETQTQTPTNTNNTTPTTNTNRR